ncbi:MAG: HAD-IA family hydrolase, partial [Leptospiraceae bacterium]|nr:HAD-IA family hydrolase [Leptospiraceae bacterium]
DMDGVLIDAREWHYEALNKALSCFGLAITRYDHLVTFDGLPTRKKLEMLSIESGLPARLHSFINDLKQQYTMEEVHARCKPIFQHEYALSRLRSEGYRLGVASNSIRKTVEIMMEKANLSQYLDVVFSNEDVRHAKPHPEIYQKAIRHFQFNPEECVVVEDNEKGVAAARDAGAHVLVVDSVYDVTHDNIQRYISMLEGA